MNNIRTNAVNRRTSKSVFIHRAHIHTWPGSCIFDSNLLINNRINVCLYALLLLCTVAKTRCSFVLFFFFFFFFFHFPIPFWFEPNKSKRFECSTKNRPKTAASRFASAAQMEFRRVIQFELKARQWSVRMNNTMQAIRNHHNQKQPNP